MPFVITRFRRMVEVNNDSSQNCSAETENASKKRRAHEVIDSLTGKED